MTRRVQRLSGRRQRPGAGPTRNAAEDPLLAHRHPLAQTHAALGNRSVERMIQSNPGAIQWAPLPSKNGPLAGLQATIGNRAVARMIETERDSTRSATAPIQRFAFDQPDWNQATEITRSGDGAQGVVFFKDGTDLPLVTKASKDPPRETTFATLFFNKMGKKRDISAPPTRVASDIERVRIATQIQQKGAWEGELRASDVEQFGHQAPNVWVMGMAKGKAFGSDRQRGEGFTQAPLGAERTVMLIENPDYIRKLGFVTACDLFLGNGDRMDVGNLGNWMTDEAGAISLIDNFSSESYQGLTERAQTQWEQVFMDDLKPSNYLRKGETVYNVLASSVPARVKEGLEKSFTTTPEGRKRLFAKHFAKGMADARKLILAKLAPTFGKRSRSLKQSVVTGEGGELAWQILKRRVRLFKSLA
jgi:hypothetical protein